MELMSLAYEEAGYAVTVENLKLKKLDLLHLFSIL